MGIFNFIKGQFIDVISWLDDSNNTLCWRFPDSDHEIKNGAKLTVREGQVAIFVSEGQIGDVFKPGLYNLTTQNIPVLTSLKSWKYAFESPFKAEVYFINTRQYLDMKWGTMNPIPMRDADFGIVRVRAFGVYSIKVTDPVTFFKTFVGTDGHFTTEEIEGQLRKTLVSTFTNTLGQAKIPVLDLAGNYDAIADKLSAKMDPEFGKGGISLAKFIIENISLPPEVEKAIDTRSSMGAVGNMGQFMQYQAGQAMREAASNPSGSAGAFAGLGAGMGIGQVYGQTTAQAMSAPPPPVAEQFHVNGPNGQQGPMPAASAAAIIRSAGGAPITVWSAGMTGWVPWQQVQAIALHVGPPPAAPPPPPPPPLNAPPPIAAEPAFHYSGGGAPEGPLPASAIAARIKANAGAPHKVWREGMPAWADAASVPEIAARLGAAPPPLS